MGLGGVWVTLFFGNDLLCNNFPYSKGFKIFRLKFGRDSEGEILKVLKSSYLGEKTPTLVPLAMFKGLGSDCISRTHSAI